MASRMSSGKSSKDDSSISDLISNSKLTRPQASRTGSLERLPSLRPQRDLTLGGVPKKTFTPTVPARRTKRDPPPSSGDQEKMSEDSSSSSRRKTQEKRGRGRGRGKERERKRGKEVVTSASVFSMGPAERTLEGKRETLRGGYGEGGGGKRSIKKEKPELNDLKMTRDLDYEDEAMDVLPGSEGGGELFRHSQLPPTCLPLDYSMHTRHRTVLTKQVKVKQEPTSSDQTDFPAARVTKPVRQVIGPPAPAKLHETTAAELFTPSEGSKGQFLFLQLPDCLPISRPPPSSSGEPMEVGSGAATSTAQTSSSNSQTTTSQDSQRHCTLHDVPEGLIGKLRVFKSGKVKLALGDVTLDVAMGTPCGFLQQLVCVRPEEVTVLGQISHRLVCTPDFEALTEDSLLQNT